MIYLKYFLKGHRLNFYGPFDPNINPHLCHDMTYPPTKFDVVSAICHNECIMINFKLLVFASWQGLYSPTDLKIIL